MTCRSCIIQQCNQLADQHILNMLIQSNTLDLNSHTTSTRTTQQSKTILMLEVNYWIHINHYNTNNTNHSTTHYTCCLHTGHQQSTWRNNHTIYTTWYIHIWTASNNHRFISLLINTQMMNNKLNFSWYHTYTKSTFFTIHHHSAPFAAHSVTLVHNTPLHLHIFTHNLWKSSRQVVLDIHVYRDILKVNICVHNDGPITFYVSFQYFCESYKQSDECTRERRAIESSRQNGVKVSSPLTL